MRGLWHRWLAFFNRQSVRTRQWLWFITLYVAGFVAISIFAYGLRWLIKGSF